MSNVLPQGWEEKELKEFINFNPKETLKKGVIAKSIPMACLTEFCRNITKYEEKEFNSGMKFRNGDTLLARITPCLENGKTAYVDFLDKDEIAFGSTEYIVLREKKDVSDKKFIYYLSISTLFRDIAIKSMTGSSGRQRVQNDVLFKEKFIIPSDINEQKRIADILSAFDDKIELNNQMNQTLEDMATTLFKEWFENFNFPNEQGKPYKDNDGEMKSSVLGEIPIDWEVKYLKEIAEIIMGQSPKGRSYNEENIGFPLINGASDFEGTLPKAKKYTTEPTKISNDNDIVFGIRATIGNVVFLNKGYCLGRGVAAVRVTTQLLEFMFLLLKKEVDNLAQIATGSVFANLTKSDLEKLKLVFPNKIILVEFSKIIKPIFEQIQQNQQQNQTLKQQRDILLPKLMTGEKRV